MRKIKVSKITTALAKGFSEINVCLPNDVKKSLEKSIQQEKSRLGKSVLQQLRENAKIAKKQNLPLCQDTGTALIFLEIGQEIVFTGGNLFEAIQEGVKKGYQNLRKSIVSDPLRRKNTQDNTPAIIHTTIVPGDKLTLHIMAKGGGAENKSALAMLLPTSSEEDISEFVVKTVASASAACPPLIVGIGLGGTFDSCPILAKKALFRKIGSKHPDPYYNKLEQKLCTKLNKLNIGPAGYGGNITCLAVFIETAPCHIASLPVAVNIQCHASRHKKIII